MTGGLTARLHVVAFSFDDRDVTFAEVILGGIVSREWTAFTAEVERAAAALAHGLVAPGPEELRSQAVGLRRELRLLTAAELEAWLVAHALDAERFAGAARRRVARQALHAGGPNPPPLDDRAALAEAVEADAWCTGSFERVARRLQRWMAAPRRTSDRPAPADDPARMRDLLLVTATDPSGVGSLGDDRLRATLGEMLELEARYDAVVEGCRSPERVEPVLREHDLDWSLLDYEEIAFGSDGAAREARLLVREDGDSVESVAALVGSGVRRSERYAEEVPRALGVALLAAAPDVPTMPVATEEGWTVAWLRRRRRPSLRDPVLVARAVEMLVEDVLDASAAASVVWRV